ncbi:M23 family metallopeptidase [Sphingomonas sp.]|jgi:murein DD-endopeptidase MepM/ murein hydrolase activator NlpD|uniref:M23 family metallopeptidase n=1 Tax=Sphingomonas sp. TaxID=28214 RepID=UPI002D7E9EBD|nr:M23 family metallopeptidase [Sphingomonas sp.]HEU0044799.1 M23 family metallopeptidase [Sphingomonas sp.]
MTREVGGSEGDVSFDPKSWAAPAEGARATKPAASVQPAEATFDPKSWAAGTTPPLPPAAAPSVEPVRRSTAGAPPLVFAGVASALLLLGGGLAAHLTRVPIAAPAAVDAVRPAALPVSAPADAVTASRRTLVVAGPAEVATTLASTGIAPATAAALARSAVSALGDAAGEIRMVLDLVGAEGARRLTRLEATRDDGSGVVLTAAADGSFASEPRQPKLVTQVKVVRGEMDATSFYNAAVTAGVTDTLISDIAKALSYDFNFATDIKAGDIFEVAFEQKVNPSGEAVGAPALLYVWLQTSTKSKALYRFLAPGEAEPGWFDGNGRSTVTALMRTPVDGARITSNFGPRFHPVLHYNRLHGGTDFAAPVGTPIYSAAGGTVVSASPSRCAGNMAIIKHDNGWETRYFHLSRYADGIVAGARVTQGFTIGQVGNTGTCTTGPHLHYEVHIDGQKVDPMGIDTGSGKVLGGDALAAFRNERDRIDQSRAGGPMR